MDIDRAGGPLTLRPRTGCSGTFAQLDELAVRDLGPFTRPLNINPFELSFGSSDGVPRLAAVAKHVRGTTVESVSDKTAFQLVSLVTSPVVEIAYAHILCDYRGGLEHRIFRIASDVVSADQRGRYVADRTDFERRELIELARAFERYMVVLGDSYARLGRVSPFLCRLQADPVAYGFDGERYFINRFETSDDLGDWIDTQTFPTDEDLRGRRDAVLERLSGKRKLVSPAHQAKEQ